MNNRILIRMVCSALFLFVLSSFAGNPVTVYEKPSSPSLSWAVFVADTTETFAARYDKERVSMGVAQGIIEQDLLDSSFELVNLNVGITNNEWPPRSKVLQNALALEADYLIYGQVNASRVLASESGSVSGGHSRSRSVDYFNERDTEWGGINKPTYAATLSVQVIRVEDGRLMASDQAASTGSAQARTGVQGAVTEATNRLLRSLLPTLEDIQRDERRETKRSVIEL